LTSAKSIDKKIAFNVKSALLEMNRADSLIFLSDGMAGLLMVVDI
jgi:hypothetical protein